ncbi:MAG: hypothetical protein ACI4N3_03545 [Alphaproteobacteria bacterium]
MSEIIGTFRGTILRQTKGEFGGARSVFAKFKGLKNELVYPYNGGIIMNPPKGTGFKMFAGDLMEIRYDADYANPSVYLLKTFLVESVSEDSKTIGIIKDKFKHKPFVGDKIGVAPAVIGDTMTSGTITKVVSAKVGDTEVWSITLDTALTGATKGDILVEADEEGKMLVKAINAFADSDIDLPYDSNEGDDEYEKAKYAYVPAVGGVYIYIKKMSPIPPCVLKENKSQFNGLFKLPTVG